MDQTKKKSTVTKDFRIPGEDTVVEVVQAYDQTDRDSFKGKPVCQLLAQHHILHAGLMHAQYPFHIARANQSGTFILSCFSGEGRVLADGKWITVKAGEACILPPFVANSLKCIKGKKWSFSYVRYIESRDSVPIVTEISPVKGPYDPEPLRLAIRGLIAESSENAVPASQHHWVELIHHYVLRFAQPHQHDERLWKLWSKVKKDLARDWNLTLLAENAFLSEEHLRRLCNKQLGRSPMQHLTFLRMLHASELLSTTDLKLDSVAHSIGYATGSHFSNVFTKWLGVRPSEFRDGKRD